MEQYNYTPTLWVDGKTVGTAEVLNNIEDNVKSAHDRLNEHVTQFNTMKNEMAGKSELNNTRVQIINSKDDTVGVADFANFAGQGETGAPIGYVLHHYTDSIPVQIDNVGENPWGIMVLKNAINPFRRPDKPSDFYGKSNFLCCRREDSQGEIPIFILTENGNIDKYGTFTIKGGLDANTETGVEILDMYGSRDLFSVRINGNHNPVFKVFNDGIDIKNSVDIKYNSILFKSGEQSTIATNKIDDGFWGFMFDVNNKHANAYQFKNGGTTVASILNLSGVDCFQIENSLRYSGRTSAPAGLYGNTYYNSSNGYFYAYDKMSDTYKPFNEQYGNSAPTTGTWKVGDKVYNKTPSSGGYLGWVCITAGVPGTWKGFGLIES